jgi:hypothetical protein
MFTLNEMDMNQYKYYILFFLISLTKKQLNLATEWLQKKLSKI